MGGRPRLAPGPSCSPYKELYLGRGSPDRPKASTLDLGGAGGNVLLWWVFDMKQMKTGHSFQAGGLLRVFKSSVPFAARQPGYLLEHKMIV